MKAYFTKRIKKLLAAFTLCFAVTFVSVAGFEGISSYAYTATGGTVKNGPVQVRKEPVNGTKITSLSTGTAVTVVDETSGSDGYIWYKVQFTYASKTYEGYVRSDFIELSNVDTSVESSVTDSSLAGSTGTVANTTSGVYVRSGAGTAYSVLTKVYQGQTMSILGQTTVNNKVWYSASMTVGTSTYNGWICGDYVVVSQSQTGEQTQTATASDAEYVAALKAAGFPDSYCSYLLTLHQKYPNWQFVPVQTGLDWSTVIANESTVGKNLVQNSVNDSRKSTASGAYDWATNTWYGYDGANWVCASSDYIAYCMDPRNFLNETYIFQFETLEYADYQNSTGVSNILSGTFMSGNYTDTDGATRSYADTFVEVGKGLSVSPYHLASRCKQEQGTKGTSGLISGTYSGYNGYYNYFNINAYTTSTASSTVNGLSYAKSVGWDSIYKSINGGAAIVADRYVKKGQNTIYFEKFNVVNASNLYAHQYMTNVMAAISEGSSISKAYSDKSAAFVFRIPVYNNMPEQAVTFVDSGNPNNWLSALTISGYSLTPVFQPSVTSYSLIVDESINSITVGATAVAEKSTITGTGNYSLNYGNNTINVTCISQSGASRTYTITVVREQPAGSENTGGNTTSTDGTTGMTNGETVTYGDINGDGKISNADVVLMQKQILGMISLSGTQSQAADISRDGRITNKDLVMLQKHILKIELISQ